MGPKEVRERRGVKDLGARMRRAEIRWLGNAEQREENDMLMRKYDFETKARPAGAELWQLRFILAARALVVNHNC